MKLKVGKLYSTERVFTQPQFDRFAALSGDDNPIHVDPAFSARTKFGRTVAHGMFLYANLWRVQGELAPGAFQREQELMFPTPTYTGEIVRLDLRVVAASEGTARLATNVVKQDGTIGCEGSALLAMLMPDGLPAAAPPESPPSGDIWKGLAVGQSAGLTRAYTRFDLAEYLDLLGETNPLYTEPALARGLGLRGVPLPGPLLGSLFSCLLGTELPGRGTNWLKQRFVFLRAAYPDSQLEARVRITRIRPEKALVNLRTWVSAADGLVCDGEALVWVGDMEERRRTAGG